MKLRGLSSLKILKEKARAYTRKKWLRDLDNELNFSEYIKVEKYANEVDERVKNLDSTAEELESPPGRLEIRLNRLLDPTKEPSLDHLRSIRQFTKDNGKNECLDLIRRKTKLGRILGNVSLSSITMHNFLIEFVSENPDILVDAHPIARKKHRVVKYNRVIREILDKYNIILSEMKAMDQEDWEKRL